MPGAPPGDNVGFYGSGVGSFSHRLRKTQVMSHEVFSFFVQRSVCFVNTQKTRSRSRSSERHDLLLDIYRIVSEGMPVHTSNIYVLHNKADNHYLGGILAAGLAVTNNP
eukprot:scaffold3286_cov57-Cylindrotheca_fusiformis.AAC.1